MGPCKITGAVTATALNPLHTVPGESSWNCRYRTGQELEGYRILPLALAKLKKSIIIKGVRKNNFAYTESTFWFYNAVCL